MRIAFNTYSPALTDNQMTSSATGIWFNAVVNHFIGRGDEICNVSVGEKYDRGPVLTRFFAKPVDAIILIWRWPMNSELYPRRAMAYERQLELIDLAIDHKIPVLIHDEDFKDGAYEAYSLLRSKRVPVALTAPSMFSPTHSFLPFPMYYRRLAAAFVRKSFDFGYIGNNYERYSQMRDWLKHPPIDFLTYHFWGNWLETSPERESPEQVKRDFPHVTFKGRLTQDQVISQLSHYRFTCHFAKEEYCKTGFVTMRWQEAACARTVAFVPDSFRLPAWMKPAFNFDTSDILDPQYYQKIADAQYQAIQSISLVSEWSRHIDVLVN